ncbi:hypothetical protein K435DRAFT_812623 [Dendrothele bispora CBS 962.96]|uniref:Uncharacterized protein n=1 Tax=Dendrothele bispora (strain CBS 962.96) TaxID=1314807 RepID=A0A4S8KNS3_DENBC|nr:hypothetical protein K435DRAFT_812623 [Dendrothele bispora CBS 962.96]
MTDNLLLKRLWSIHPASLIGQACFPALLVNPPSFSLHEHSSTTVSFFDVAAVQSNVCQDDIRHSRRSLRSYLGQQFCNSLELYLSSFTNQDRKRVHRNGAGYEGGNEVARLRPLKRARGLATGGGDYYVMREEVDHFESVSQDIVDELSENDTAAAHTWSSLGKYALAFERKIDTLGERPCCNLRYRMGLTTDSFAIGPRREKTIYLTPTEETLQMEYYQSLEGLEKAESQVFELQQAIKAWVAEAPG